MASDYKATPLQVTKWLKEIYRDIIDLNFEKPELFVQKDQHKVLLYMKRYDNSCSLFIGLPVIPRKYESFRFYFAKARIGGDFFWINNIEYEVNGSDTQIVIHLEYGFVNAYWEIMLEKARFYDLIHWRDTFDLYNFEIDKELKRLFPAH